MRKTFFGKECPICKFPMVEIYEDNNKIRVFYCIHISSSPTTIYYKTNLSKFIKYICTKKLLP
jgi:hypothetical protein